MSTIKSIAAVGTLVLLAVTNAYAWDQRNTQNTTQSIVSSKSAGVVAGLGGNLGRGLEVSTVQSATVGTAKVTPNTAVTTATQEGSGVSFGFGHAAGGFAFGAGSFSSAFGKDFRGTH